MAESLIVIETGVDEALYKTLSVAVAVTDIVPASFGVKLKDTVFAAPCELTFWPLT